MQAAYEHLASLGLVVLVVTEGRTMNTVLTVIFYTMVLGVVAALIVEFRSS